MSKSTKAALFSGLVFPGAGHIYLKSYPKAISLAALTIASIFIYITEAIEQSQKVMQEIEASGKVYSVEEITVLTSNMLAQTDTFLLTIASMVFISCWVFGVIDSYRLGKKNHG